ncbi:HdeD family acid-resistance protein [Listeria booriae]|uniref:HdeD family acid-resistance protein n=1 Tax=Listeria booriae TaxID=1552123 RepID=UPI001627D65C|nr:DUF308 domain-containing protein [Listeria booriae]MBC1891635.1 HdeD family acid-resistance protein [Listeria booriae]
MRKFYLYFILVMAIVMIGLGLYFVFNPGTSLAAFTFVIGIVLLLNGLNEIISYFKGRKVLKISNWILLDGAISLIAGLFILINNNIGEKFIVLIFVIWVLASAILNIMMAFSVKGSKGWIFVLIIGIIGAIIAIISLFSSAIVAVTVGLILGGFFIFQGIACLLLFNGIRKQMK